MKKITLSARLRYRFDNLMSKGAGVLLLSLAGLTALVIVVVSLVAWAAHASPDTTFPQYLWMGLMRSMDSGTIAGDSGSLLFMVLMFVVTLSGILILSILIGILTTGIQAKLESLRKGRSQVLEKDQTIILGWSEQVFPILQELIEANANRKRACVVIMGNEDKSQMDSAIRERIPHTRTTRIVTRQGNPIDVDDLDIVDLNASRSIIVLSEDDISAVKTILAITNNRNKRQEPYHIVAVLRDPKYLEVAQIAGNGQAEIILSQSFIARIIAQTCRQPGLSVVYTELLDFGGDEIYFADCREAAGKTFGETLQMFEKSAVIGVCSGNETRVNPPMDTVLLPGDKIIAISEDDDTVVPGGSAAVDEDAIEKHAATPMPLPEKTLLLGWNANARSIIEEMDNYVPEASLITVVSENVGEEQAEALRQAVRRQKVEAVREDPKSRSLLDGLLARGYNHVILLCDGDGCDMQETDANTLVVLLHLRDIAEKTGLKFSVTSEMLDFRNKKLAEATKVNDFIVSEKLVSLMLTQVSENKLLNAVLQDLFDADGSEIYLKPVTGYVKPGRPVNFYTVVEAARRRGHVAIGYVIAAEQADEAKSYGIHVNPRKGAAIVFSEKDSVIVIAED